MQIEIKNYTWQELFFFYPLTTPKDPFKHLQGMQTIRDKVCIIILHKQTLEAAKENAFKFELWRKHKVIKQNVDMKSISEGENTHHIGIFSEDYLPSSLLITHL